MLWPHHWMVLLLQGHPLGKWNQPHLGCFQLDVAEIKGMRGCSGATQHPGRWERLLGGGVEAPVLPARARSAMEPRWQYQFRVIMLGDSTVGKSSLLRRYTEGVFLDAINQTVGVDFHVQFVELQPGLRVKLQFWDTAGQERFRSVTRSYYRNSAGGMLLFDLTNRASFESVRRWHREVMDTLQPSCMVFLLVGHKSDLVGQRRVGRKEAEKLAASLGVQYVETSAKDASNVVQAFQMLTLAIYQALQAGRLAAGEAWHGVKSSVPLPAPRKAQGPEKEEKRCSC